MKADNILQTIGLLLPIFQKITQSLRRRNQGRATLCPGTLFGR